MLSSTRSLINGIRDMTTGQRRSCGWAVFVATWVVAGCDGVRSRDANSAALVERLSAGMPSVRSVPLDELDPALVPGLGRAVAVGPAGQLAFVPAGAPGDDFLLNITDSTGRTVSRFGREGSGPGELRMPMFLAFTRDTALVVWDMSLLRVSSYSASGALLDSFDQGVSRPSAAVIDSIDVIDAARPTAPIARRPLRGGRARDLIDMSDRQIDSLFPVMNRGGVQSRGVIAYATGAGRIALGHGIGYHILIFDDLGRVIGSTGRSVPPQFPSAEQLAAESLSTLRLPISPARRAQLLRESRERPMVFFRELRFDEVGRLWVVRPQDGSAVADVYADTELLGSIPLDCPDFQGSGMDLSFGWLVLSCRNTDPDAPSDGTFKLFRIEGD